MATDAIVRVSFESAVGANRGANKALVGVQQGKTGSGPFTKTGTAVYSCFGGDDAAVAGAIAQLGAVLVQFSGHVDFVSISLSKQK